MRFPGFIGPSYTLQSVNADAQRCINLYAELNEIGTGKEREVACLRGTPGLKLMTTLGTGPAGRGSWTTSTGVLFVVSGNGVYLVDSSWSGTLIGTLNTSTGPVSMSDNGIQLAIVDGANGYYVTLATPTTVTQITDPAFLNGATHVTFQDSYFLFNKPNSQQFFISDSNAISFNALNVGTAEGLPDYLIGLISDQRNLFLFGTLSTEIFYDSGATFPFERIQGAFIPVGCIAGASILKLQGAVYWLGQSESGRGIVYRTQGLQPQRISTHAIETIIRASGSLTTARAWAYEQDGHGFYCLTLPGASTTWVYDTTTSLWHERSYLNQGANQRHLADCHTFAYQTNVVGDYQNGNLYALDPTKYTDNGAAIARIRAAPHISKDMNRVFHARFQLDLEPGVGLDGTTQGTDPQAILDWSNDGGHSWSNEHWTAIGKIGVTLARAIWRRLGMARDRVYRIRITDPVKVTLLGADLLLEEESS